MNSTTFPWQQLLDATESSVGLTAPNPPVGAMVMDSQGNPISLATHEGAGKPHAEPQAILLARQRSQDLHTLCVTLEPCNHFGKTPPCTKAIIDAGIKTVLFLAHDPNPRVLGGGAKALESAGVRVVYPSELPSALKTRASKLILGFRQLVLHERPWITLKIAIRDGGTMIPPSGHKTFTSTQSIEMSHRLRRRSDAIITGSGTVLADQPEFTVRAVKDHSHKRRILVILDRRKRVPDSYIEESKKRNFEVWHLSEPITWSELFKKLGARGTHHALVEAGPKITDALLNAQEWDEKLVIEKLAGSADDRYSWEYRDPQCLQEL